VRAAESVEGGRSVPDFGKALLAHVPEFEAGYRFRGMTGKNLAGRGYVERLAPPSAHAGFRIARIVVRYHAIDDDRVLELLAQALDRCNGGEGVFARRHQRCTVLESPAIILGMSDLDPSCRKLNRQAYKVLDLSDIAAVDHGIDGQRKSKPGDDAGD